VAWVALDVSELHKAEAGLTCLSLVFSGETEPFRQQIRTG
jgi:hypothetical protein